MSWIKFEYGAFANDMPYTRWGEGEKTMLILPGGPGNNLPRGFGARMMTKAFKPFAEEHTIWFLGRRQGQPQGYTTRDMSHDCAGLIQEEFGGVVDAVIGMSYGGLIATYLAADHPDCFRRIVLLMAAHRVSDVGREIDYRFAKLLSRGKPRQAAAGIAEAMFPAGIVRLIVKGIVWLIGPIMLKGAHEAYAKDVLIEAEAECAHDAGDILASIIVPVLICVGADDIYFPTDIVEETARRIPKARLELYEGRRHATLMRDKRLIPDILDFISGS
jgi:pimeloyl-ACP methyl ester carboxylesterase